MFGGLNNRSGVHHRAAIAVAAIYLFAAVVAALLHNEDCHADLLNTGSKDILHRKNACPACMFSVSSKSIEIGYGSDLLIAKRPAISQFTPYIIVVSSDEWASSIFLRAPPATITS